MIILTSLLAGCQLFGSGNSNLDKPSDTPSSSYFPLTTGSTWTYAVYDSTYSMHSNLVSASNIQVTVTVLKNVQVDSTHLTSLWQFQFPGHTDTVSVTLTGDSVRIKVLPTTSYTPPNAIFITPEPVDFILPLSVGQKWSGEGINGTYSVISEDTLSINGMSYSRAWHIVQTPEEAIGNEYIGYEYWIQPGVGIVKAHEDDACTVCGTDGNTVVVVWKLLSFNLNP